MSAKSAGLGIVTAAAFAVGCEDHELRPLPIDGGIVIDEPPIPAAFSATGIVGNGGPAVGTVVVAWFVPDPERAYSFGSGTSRGTHFTVTLDTAPPAAALPEDGDFGMAPLVLMPEGTVVAEGNIDETDIEGMLGLSDGAIVYNRAGAPTSPWGKPFPPGFSCAKCVRVSGEIFDTLELVSCASLRIEVTEPAGGWCNLW
jgi:hypothetical protein